LARQKQRDDGSPPTKPVRIDRGLAEKAKIIAADRGIDMGEYISGMIEGRVMKDWADVVREMNREK
jgi:hypothetical protein